jgi:hypothetical protein
MVTELAEIKGFKGAIYCPDCSGTGEAKDSPWTLELARQNPAAYNVYRLKREYGEDTKVQILGSGGVVSPLHFQNYNKEKCYTCHGNGYSKECLKHIREQSHIEQVTTENKQTAEYLTKYPYLIKKEGHDNPATKNIKIELKRAFPDVKFSVRREHYSAININWENGPTDKEVTAITDKYQEGHFDGMTDCYEYNRDTFNNTFGGAQYVFENRSFSKEDYTAVIKSICNIYGVAYNDEEWKIQLPNIGESACHIANRIIGHYSIPAGKKIAGIEHTEQNGGQIEELYKLTFTA